MFRGDPDTDQERENGEMNHGKFGNSTGHEVKSSLVCLLILISAPLVVLGEEVTLYVYDFDDPSLPEWGDTQSPSGRTGPIFGNMASFSARDGYVFGNLSGVDHTSVGGSGFYGYSVE